MADTDEYVQEEEQTMDRVVSRSETRQLQLAKKEEEQQKKAAEAAAAVSTSKKSKVPRPANPWILYRSDCLAKIKEERGPQPFQTEISKELSIRWLNETAEVKELYRDKARQAKQEHEDKYPEYKFKPRKKPGGGVRSKSAAKGTRTVRNVRRQELGTRKVLNPNDWWNPENDNPKKDRNYVQYPDRRGRKAKVKKSSVERREEDEYNEYTTRKHESAKDNAGITVDLSFDDAESEDLDDLAITPVFTVQVGESPPPFSLDGPELALPPAPASAPPSAPPSKPTSRAQTPNFTLSEPCTSYTHAQDMDAHSIPPYLRQEIDTYINTEATPANEPLLDPQSMAAFANFAYDPDFLLAPETAANLANEWANIDTACLDIDYAMFGGGDAAMDFDFEIGVGDGSSGGFNGSNFNFDYINDVFGDIPAHVDADINGSSGSAPIDIPATQQQERKQSMFKYINELPTIPQEAHSHEDFRAGVDSSCSSVSTISSVSSAQSYAEPMPEHLNTQLNAELTSTHIGDRAKDLITDYFDYEDREPHATPSHHEIFKAFQRQLAQTRGA